MSDHSHTQCTDATWNPTVGCSRVSDGCTNCFAIRDARRLAQNPHPGIAFDYHGLTRPHRTAADGRPDWTGTVRLLPHRPSHHSDATAP